MIRGVNLISLSSQSTQQNDLTSNLTEQLKFKYDFVQRYYSSKEAILRWEESAGIPEDHSLDKIVLNGWKSYCGEIISKLQAKVNFTKMAIAFCSSALGKDSSGSKYLKYVNQEIEDAIACIEQVIDHPEMKATLEQSSIFGESANQSFNSLLQQKAEELIVFCKEAVEKSNLVRSFELFFFCFFLVNLPKVSQRIHHQLLITLNQNFANLIEQLDESAILDSAQEALTLLNLDNTESTIKLFSHLIFENLSNQQVQQKNASQASIYRSLSRFVYSGELDYTSEELRKKYEDLRITCSALLPFKLNLSRMDKLEIDSGSAAPSPPLKIIGTKVEFDGFSLKELLSQSLPN